MTVNISKIKYPELERILNIYPNPEIILGEEIFWTEKRDGSNIGAYLDENDNLQLRSRNMDKASDDFYKYFNETEQAENIKELLSDARNWKKEYVVFGELLTKGKSPTRIELHDKHEFIIFDIWELPREQWLSYNSVYQQCYHFGLPVVELYGTCNLVTREKLFEFKDLMLVKALECKREGVVGKCWNTKFKNGIQYFKEKHDLPPIEKLPRLDEEGKITLPVLPDSEVYGAIEKARTDLGDRFSIIKEAMPLIAKYISIECKKHNSSQPKNLHQYYQQRLKDIS
jgi:hypothetical protein